MKDFVDLEMSDLEKEIELEMDDSTTGEHETDDNSGEELEIDAEGESDEDRELGAAIEDLGESQFESSDSERALEQGAPDEFAQRFYELSTRDFEDESDLDREIGGILTEMERQYFWGGVKGLFKKGLKYGVKSLRDKAMQYGKGLVPFKAITQLARGNLKGALGSLAKQGLGAALRMHPAGAAGLSALQGLGFNPLGEAETNREAWNNYTAVAREAYDHLAQNLNESSDKPVEASRQAATAFQSALQKVQSRTSASSSQNRKVYRIRVRPGQRIKLIIQGV